MALKPGTAPHPGRGRDRARWARDPVSRPCGRLPPARLCLGSPRLSGPCDPGSWTRLPADVASGVPGEGDLVGAASRASPARPPGDAGAPPGPGGRPPAAPSALLGPVRGRALVLLPLRAPGSAALRGGGGGGGARGRDPPASPSWSPGNPASAAWPPPAPAPAASRRSLGAPQPARPLRRGLRSAGPVPARPPPPQRPGPGRRHHVTRPEPEPGQSRWELAPSERGLRTGCGELPLSACPHHICLQGREPPRASPEPSEGRILPGSGDPDIEDGTPRLDVPGARPPTL